MDYYSIARKKEVPKQSPLSRERILISNTRKWPRRDLSICHKSALVYCVFHITLEKTEPSQLFGLPKPFQLFVFNYLYIVEKFFSQSHGTNLLDNLCHFNIIFQKQRNNGIGLNSYQTTWIELMAHKVPRWLICSPRFSLYHVMGSCSKYFLTS